MRFATAVSDRQLRSKAIHSVAVVFQPSSHNRTAVALCCTDRAFNLQACLRLWRSGGHRCTRQHNDQTHGPTAASLSLMLAGLKWTQVDPLDIHSTNTPILFQGGDPGRASCPHTSSTSNGLIGPPLSPPAAASRHPQRKPTRLPTCSSGVTSLASGHVTAQKHTCNMVHTWTHT